MYTYVIECLQKERGRLHRIHTEKRCTYTEKRPTHTEKGPEQTEKSPKCNRLYSYRKTGEIAQKIQ